MCDYVSVAAGMAARAGSLLRRGTRGPRPPYPEWGRSAQGFEFKVNSGVADGARTHDNWNHNPGLYQLSYGHRCTSGLCGAFNARPLEELEILT